MIETSPKICLVTGAGGFIGCRLAEEFSTAGYAVTGVDRGFFREPQAGSSLRLVKMELPAPELTNLIAELRPSVIVNAAGPASVAGSIDDPRADFHGTIDVLMSVLDAVRVTGVEARLVTMSSAAVYGNPESLPVREDATLAPVSPYGFHRQIAETLLAEYRTAYGLRSCAARVFSAYGPGLRRQVLWDICRKAAAGSPIELSGTGEETRDFIHVRDVAHAVRVLAENAQMSGEAYNVASGVETSIAELAGALVAHVAPGAQIAFSGVQRAGDPLRWRADASAIAALGFAPQVALADGIAEYARWFAEEGRS